jgi:mannose-6-phosphate isomerase-like protein (cupin superfamily)
MNDKKYFIGKISNYTHKKGWFFGHFMEEPLLQSDLVEVAYQDVSNKKADPKDWHYHKKSLEINIVISGEAKFKINGESVTVGEGEFYVVYPYTSIEDFSTSNNTKIIVVRAPSIVGDKFAE